jgi:hypothetical protein
MSQADDSEAIPDDLRRFILTSIPSVPFMEAMLLFKALPGQPVATRSVAARLYVGEKQAALLVEQLCAARIVEPAGGGAHRYAPDAALAAMLDRIAHAYVQNLIGVTRLIHSRTERMAQQFADAFKFRKDH